ncbi:protein of unknown function [Mesotoga infera]|uniref:Transcriptional regulator n=1 Tax=Mesotoga infera TaxID=1236046 RepID=A0A7Z7LEN2_9BACT|nr:protein of unknown function [Mesotoga infera]
MIDLKDKTWSSKWSGERISSELKDRDSVTTGELKPFLTLPGEEVSPVTIRTRLNALKRRGVITSVGRGLYTLKEKNRVRLLFSSINIRTQDMTYSLFDTPRRAFALRPDIVLEFGKHKVVMDTK